ncbi:MAG: SET domain-containing protein-lysine N-methyltransferase [Patescibacteria group bacterium]
MNMTSDLTLLGTGKFGKCLIASRDIKKDELIASFDGEIYEAESCNKLPKDIADHAIQFEEHKWRDSAGLARFINHSCLPNCGTRDFFDIVAMQDIQKGEELTWDYAMTEDSDWRMRCECGSQNCRKIIGAFSLLDNDTREKYRGYISLWLVNKYNL